MKLTWSIFSQSRQTFHIKEEPTLKFDSLGLSLFVWSYWQYPYSICDRLLKLENGQVGKHLSVSETD